MPSFDFCIFTIDIKQGLGCEKRSYERHHFENFQTCFHTSLGSIFVDPVRSGELDFQRPQVQKWAESFFFPLRFFRYLQWNHDSFYKSHFSFLKNENNVLESNQRDLSNDMCSRAKSEIELSELIPKCGFSIINLIPKFSKDSKHTSDFSSTLAPVCPASSQTQSICKIPTTHTIYY